VVVEEAGITEQGRRHELIAADGVYRRLHEAQYRTLAGVE